MEMWEIEGGLPLRGEVRVARAKNAVLPQMAAALLTEEPVRILDAPELTDVGRMAQMLIDLGGTVRSEGGALDIVCASPRAKASGTIEGLTRASVLALGPLLATGVGVNVKRQTRLLLALAVGASSVCCAVGGGLSFVGLVCPHMARRLVGPNFRRLVPATVLVGADLMLFADVISRTLLLPAEIPVGIVVAVIGAPYFLYLLAKS